MGIYENNDVLRYLHMMYNSDISALFSKVWADDEYLIDHLIEKYDGYYRAYHAAGAPAPFFCALDSGNQRKLLDYARNNYPSVR